MSEVTTDQLTPRCWNCGYNVHGVASDECPECGSIYYLELARFQREGLYRTTCQILDESGIEYRKVELTANRDPTGQILSMGRPFASAAIFVRRSDFDRASSLYEAVLADAPRPIVDRTEPFCPKCNASMDADGPEQCPTCGAEFQWVNIDEEPIDPTGRSCRHCGYELTGNVSGSCPECGAPIMPRVLDQEIDARALESDAPQTAADPAKIMRRVWTYLFALILTMVLVKILLSVSELSIQDQKVAFIAAGGVILLLVVCILALSFAIRYSRRT